MMTITLTESQVEGLLFLILLIAGVIVAAMIPILDYRERKRRDAPKYPEIQRSTDTIYPTYDFERRMREERVLHEHLLEAARHNSEQAIRRLMEARKHADQAMNKAK